MPVVVQKNEALGSVKILADWGGNVNDVEN
jgi:hypothetical protein